MTDVADDVSRGIGQDDDKSADSDRCDRFGDLRFVPAGPYAGGAPYRTTASDDRSLMRPTVDGLACADFASDKVARAGDEFATRRPSKPRAAVEASATAAT